MGICGEKQSTQDGMHGTRPTEISEKFVKPKSIIVYGHYFNSDTRTILALLEISQAEYEFEEVDIFRGAH